MSASGGFTPPEFPSGTPQRPEGPRQPGVPVAAALAILVGVLAVGLVLVFTFGHPKSTGSALAAQPGAGSTPRIPGSGGSARPTPGASSPAPTATGEASGGTAGSGGQGGDGEGTENSPAFAVGECVDTAGTGTSFTVDQASCSSADFKIIYAYQNESGSVDADESQCYTINGNDDEFENGDAEAGYTLYCMNSLIGDYSPRRAVVDNCLDSDGKFEVDCTSSKATWIVIGRLNGTTNTKSCSQFGSYDQSYYWSAAPPFVLCVDKYSH